MGEILLLTLCVLGLVARRLPRLAQVWKRPGLAAFWTLGACVLALLSVAQTLLFPPPYPSQFLRPGAMGFFLPPLLAAWAAMLLARKWRWLHGIAFFLLALVVVPMVIGPEWISPISEAWMWAATGSASGLSAAVFGTLVLILGAATLVLPTGLLSGRWGRVLAAAALALLWLSLPLQLAALPGIWALQLGLSAALLTCAALLGATALSDARQLPGNWVQTLEQWRQPLLSVVPVSALVALYFILRTETLAWSATDENIYFQAAHWVADGRPPYRDFFFSHPPLHLLIPALLLKLFGHAPYLLKLIPVVFSVGSGLLVYWMVLRQGKVLAALLAAGAFFFALEQLQASTNLTGVNITTFFVVAAAWALLAQRPWLAAGAGCAALMSGAYATIPVLALLLPAFLLQGPRMGLRFVGGLAGGFLGLTGLCRLVFGEAYFEQVYQYHFRKAAGQAVGYMAPGGTDLLCMLLVGAGLVLGSWLVWQIRQARHEGTWTGLRQLLKRPFVIAAAGACGLILLGVGLGFTLVHTVPGSAEGALPETSFGGLALLWTDLAVFLGDDEFLRFAYFHSHLLLAPVLLALLALLEPLRTRLTGQGGPRGSSIHPAGWMGLLLLFASLVQLSIVKETYTFYYLLAIPGGAMALGVAWELASRWIPQGSMDWRRQSIAASVGLMLLVGIAAYQPLSLAIGAQRWPEEKAARYTQVCYPWREGTATPFSPMLRRWLHTPCRTRGSTEAGLLHYLWKKKGYFSRAEELAAYIRSHSAPGETILGASVIAPLLSHLSGRDLAAGYVDTNSKRFKTGMVLDPAAATRLCQQRPELTEAQCMQQAAWREMWERACRTPLKFVVAAPKSAFQVSELSRNPLIRKYFRAVGLFNEPRWNLEGSYPIVLYQRISDKPDAAGHYCGFD